jgi:hypothetical protein
MATTVVAATAKITVSVELALDGVDYGTKHVQIVPAVTEVAHRVVEVGLTEIEVLAFQADDPGSGTFDEADVRFVLLTNKDDTNFIQLIFKSENNNECAHKLEKGSFMILSVSDEGVVNIHDADSSALTVSFDDLVNITALANTAACDLEYVVLGV